MHLQYPASQFMDSDFSLKAEFVPADLIISREILTKSGLIDFEAAIFHLLTFFIC